MNIVFIFINPISYFFFLEILENFINNIYLISINLPSRKNRLTASALEKLDHCLKNFDTKNNLSVAVLHGCGGNFCTGIESSQEANENGLQLIKVKFYHWVTL